MAVDYAHANEKCQTVKSGILCMTAETVYLTGFDVRCWSCINGCTFCDGFCWLESHTNPLRPSHAAAVRLAGQPLPQTVQLLFYSREIFLSACRFLHVSMWCGAQVAEWHQPGLAAL